MADTLHHAAEIGNIDKIRSLLKAGVSIYKVDKHNNTPLAIALTNNHGTVALELLSLYERDLSLIDTSYTGDIYIACSHQEINLILNWDQSDNVGTLVKVYLRGDSNGINEVKDIYISTKSHLKILNDLNENGFIDVNARNAKNESLLDLAVEFGKIDYVTKLLKLGAKNVCRCNEYDQNGFCKAVVNGNLEIVEQFLKYTNFEDLNIENNDLLVQSAAQTENVDIFNVIFDLIVNQQLNKLRIDKRESEKTDVIKQLLEKKSSSHDSKTIIHSLIQSKCFDFVIKLINKYNLRLDVATGDAYMGCSLLDYAIVANNLDLVKILIDKGMDVLKNYCNDCDVGDTNNYTNALIVSSRYGDFLIFEEIIKHISSPEIFKNGTHGTVKVLYNSINIKSIERIKLLIDLGMDLNQRCGGRTCLVEATWTDSFEIVKLVLQHLNTDPATGKCVYLDTQDAQGHCPIDYTVRLNPKQDIFKHLLNLGANLNLVDGFGWAPLHYACWFGHYEIIKLMLDHGANIELQNDKGDKAIQSAVKSGNYKSFKLFYNSKTDIEMRNKNGNTLLILAAKNNGYEICKDLLKAGADVNAVNYCGQTALHFAGEMNIINALVENGANLMSVDNNGNTPYLHIIMHWRTEYFKNHLKFDIDYTVVNKDKQNILNILLYSGKSSLENYPEIFTEDKFKLLFEYADANTYGESSFLIACSSIGIPVEVVEKIIECGNPDLNIISKDGNTAVHQLISNGNIDLLKLVLDKGANVEIVGSKSKQTPIIAGADNSQVIKLLIEYGANVNRQDEEGVTALHRAVQARNFESAKLLVAAGSDLKITDSNGKSPLDYDVDGRMSNFFTPFL